MLIVVAIVIALTRHSMKEGVYLIKRWPRWQTDADVQNCSIMMKMLVEMIGDLKNSKHTVTSKHLPDEVRMICRKTKQTQVPGATNLRE